MLEDTQASDLFSNSTLWLFNIDIENGPFIDDF
jgi:hypothetical protein